ncbi:hypothetical protein KVR01_009999 [Diaporthe batatas]|uniref:uncharacterized protein n=1 Tax=Diaporthe batatas TaxID=748121 RepID=UPI001D053ACC|nr:uncharacterized protein KVR01_009999 [Diaporthe batatas]KAG8160463.1 hypothetical protein KVR01_009999 [Diaporthe batatas]
MLSNAFQGQPPSKDGWRNDGPASPVPQRPSTPSPELPRITSDIPDFQRPPQPGNPQGPSPAHVGHDASCRPPWSCSPSQLPPSSAAETARTPGQARIEVVLDVSPHKPSPQGGLFFAEADLDHELVTSDLTARGALPAAQGPTPDALALVTPAPPTTAKRGRGRPKGWRPGMPSWKTGLPTAARAPTAPGPKSTGQKRRGRPPRQPSPTPRELFERQAAPRYMPFLCEWAGCKAELQNLARLRKHIQVVHGRVDPLLCRWAHCQGNTTVFAHESEFQHHVDEEHLTPFVWHVGDGQRNEQPVNQDESSGRPPAYLLGPDGEQVTPSVKDQEIQDFLTWRENRRRLKHILMQRDANAPSEDEDEEASNEEPLDA